MQKTYAVDWRAVSPFPSDVLSIRANSLNNDTAYPGEKVKIRVEAANASEFEIGRVSLFVRSPTAEFETNELLLGRLAPNALAAKEISL